MIFLYIKDKIGIAILIHSFEVFFIFNRLNFNEVKIIIVFANSFIIADISTGF